MKSVDALGACHRDGSIRHVEHGPADSGRSEWASGSGGGPPDHGHFGEGLSKSVKYFSSSARTRAHLASDDAHGIHPSSGSRLCLWWRCGRGREESVHTCRSCPSCSNEVRPEPVRGESCDLVITAAPYVEGARHSHLACLQAARRPFVCRDCLPWLMLDKHNQSVRYAGGNDGKKRRLRGWIYGTADGGEAQAGCRRRQWQPARS